MNLGINTDFLSASHDPDYYLKLIAESGFTHLHWCHQWNTDYIYSKSEISHYKKVIRDCGLTLQDIHASVGQEKLYFSLEEYRRKAGMELILNRIEMFAELEGTGALALHVPTYRRVFGVTEDEFRKIPAWVVQIRRTLDELMPYLEKYDCAIAIENMPNEAFEVIEELMNAYPAERLGITYDSGHGNYGFCRGLEYLDKWKHRLKVLHLNDNDGTLDRHQPPFYGTVDWEKLTKILAESALNNLPLSFELSMTHTPFFNPALRKDQEESDIRKFLSDAFERCSKVDKLYKDSLASKAETANSVRSTR